MVLITEQMASLCIIAQNVMAGLYAQNWFYLTDASVHTLRVVPSGKIIIFFS